MKMRRNLIVVLMALLVFGAAFSAAAQPKVRFVLKDLDADPNAEAFIALIEKGMAAAGTPVDLEIIKVPAGNYAEKVGLMIMSGDIPDLIYFQGWSWQPFADKDVLAPLDDYIQQDQAKGFWVDNENYIANTMWQGKTYMSVADTGSVIMFYAKELFDKAGVPYPVDGWSYADFQSAVEKTTFKEGDVQYYGYAQAGGWNGTYLRSLHWMRMNGSLEWDQIVEPKEARWLQDDIINGLQYTVVDTIARGMCPSPATIQGGGVTIATGRVALTMEGPWFLAQMQGDKPTREGGVPFDVVEPPLGATATLANTAVDSVPF